MNPDKIELQNLNKNFEYVKLANQIDSCNDCEELKNIAKSFCKLYYKQQEVVASMGLKGIDG